MTPAQEQAQRYYAGASYDIRVGILVLLPLTRNARLEWVQYSVTMHTLSSLSTPISRQIAGEGVAAQIQVPAAKHSSGRVNTGINGNATPSSQI